MEEKELKAKDIPWGYALCFNDACGLKDKCMHYQARLLKAEGNYIGQAVYPTAWQEGECRCGRKVSADATVRRNWSRRHGASRSSMIRSPIGTGLRLASAFTPTSGEVTDHTTESIMAKTCYRPNSRQTFWRSSPSSAPSMRSSSTTM